MSNKKPNQEVKYPWVWDRSWKDRSNNFHRVAISFKEESIMPYTIKVDGKPYRAGDGTPFYSDTQEGAVTEAMCIINDMIVCFGCNTPLQANRTWID